MNVKRRSNEREEENAEMKKRKKREKKRNRLTSQAKKMFDWALEKEEATKKTQEVYESFIREGWKRAKERQTKGKKMLEEKRGKRMKRKNKKNLTKELRLLKRRSK